MSNEVILMADVEGLGSEGDVVKVATGYARNYLLPRKLAAPVTEATRRRLEKNRKDREQRAADELEVAKKTAASLENVSCTIPVKMSGEDKMYGSVTAVEIAAALAEQGVSVEKSAIVLEAPIRELGVFNVPIKLHTDQEATVKVWVVEE